MLHCFLQHYATDATEHRKARKMNNKEMEKEQPFDIRFCLCAIIAVIILILFFIPIHSSTVFFILRGTQLLFALVGMIIGWPFADERLKQFIKKCFGCSE